MLWLTRLREVRRLSLLDGLVRFECGTFSAGGKAVPAVFSAEDGEAVVKVALDTFGGVHALVANAGILRDKSFAVMSEKEWDDVIAVHLKGTFKCCKAVWDIFQKQKYGRILTTASGVGICEFIVGSLGEVKTDLV